MFGCTICDHRKSVLDAEQEYEFRRRKRNSEEMELYGVSNFCSECQLVTFFVNLVDFEGPIRGSLMWNIICATAENVGKVPLQKLQDAAVQTGAPEVDNPFVIVLAPPASRELVGHQDKEEESSFGLGEIDTQLDKMLNTTSDTDSGKTGSHEAEEITVLYRHPQGRHKDFQSSMCRSIGVTHSSARRVPSGISYLQCETKQKRKRLEELATIKRRLEGKTSKLRIEVAALEKQTRQEVSESKRKSRRQRETAGASGCDSSWWTRGNLETVFGKWSPERRDKSMENQANFILMALEEQSGTNDQERHTDHRPRKDDNGTKEQGPHKENSAVELFVKDEHLSRPRNGQGNARDHISKKFHKDKHSVNDHNGTDNQDKLSMQAQHTKYPPAGKKKSEAKFYCSYKDLGETKDHRPLKDQKAERTVKDNKEKDNEDDLSLQKLYITPPPAEKVQKAPWPDAINFKAHEVPTNLRESPSEKPPKLKICKEPINCPISFECQHPCVISDFSTHLLYDHQNVLLERIDFGQTKTFHLDPKLVKKNRPTCHMVYFVKDLIEGSAKDRSSHKNRGDLLPVLVMAARIQACDVSASKGATNEASLEDDTLQFLLIWLCSFNLTNVCVVGKLSVEATCADVADSLMVRTARAYDIQAPQDMRTIYRSPSTMIMPYALVRRITQRGNRSLTVKVKIV